MIAETAYNVFQALPDEEKKRFYAMLGMAPKVQKQRTGKLMTLEEAVEFTLTKIKNAKKSPVQRPCFKRN